MSSFHGVKLKDRGICLHSPIPMGSWSSLQLCMLQKRPHLVCAIQKWQETGVAGSVLGVRLATENILHDLMQVENLQRYRTVFCLGGGKI